MKLTSHSGLVWPAISLGVAQTLFSLIIIVVLRGETIASPFFWDWIKIGVFTVLLVATVAIFLSQNVSESEFGWHPGEQFTFVSLFLAKLLALVLAIISIIFLPKFGYLNLVFLAAWGGWIVYTVYARHMPDLKLNFPQVTAYFLGFIYSIVIMYVYLHLVLNGKQLQLLGANLGVKGFFANSHQMFIVVWLFFAGTIVFLSMIKGFFSTKKAGYIQNYTNAAFIGLLALFLSFMFVTTKDGYYPYDSIFGPELDMLGQRARDSRYHLAMVRGISEAWYPSTGQNGFVFTFYHAVTHAFIAGIERLLRLTPEMLLLCYRAVIVPVFLVVTFIGCIAVTLKNENEEHHSISQFTVITMSVVFAFMVYRLQSSIVSIPTTLAVVILIGTLPVLFKNILSNNKNIHLSEIIVILLAGSILTFTKVSFGYMLLSSYGVVLLLRKGPSSITIIYAVASMSVLYLSYSLFNSITPDGGGFDFSKVKEIYFYIPYELLIVFALYIVAFGKDNNWVFALCVFLLWMVLAVAPIAALPLSGSDISYFHRPYYIVSWGLISVLGYFLIEKHFGGLEQPMIQAKATIVSLGLITLVFHAFERNRTFSFPLYYVNQTTSFMHAVSKSKGENVPAADFRKEATVALRDNWLALPTDAKEYSLNYPFYKFVKSIRAIVQNNPEKYVLYISKDLWSKSSWLARGKADKGLSLFSLTGVPLLWGVDPAVRTTAAGSRYNWPTYKDDSYHRQVTDESNLCQLAKISNFVLSVKSVSPPRIEVLNCKKK